MNSRIRAALLATALLLLPALSGSCFKPEAESHPLGSEKNPLQMALVPSTEAEKLVESADQLLPLLEERTGLHFESFVAPSYVGIVEAMSIGKVHVAWLPPLAYVFAHGRNGDEVVLKVIRDGKATYHGQVVVMADSGIESLADLKGKRIAFVESASSSGYQYPMALFEQNGLNPETDFAETLFAGSHDGAILALLNGNADAACSYDDAREKVKAGGIEDVMERTKILAVTPEIPADNVTLYGALEPELKQKITEGLLAVAAEPEGAKVLMELYEIEGLAPATDADYAPVREMAEKLGLDIERELAEKD